MKILIFEAIIKLPLIASFIFCLSFSCQAQEEQGSEQKGPSYRASDQLSVKSMIDGSNQFAFEFYQIQKEKNGNICFSPYSITFGLAMAASGAGGETEQQFQKLLHYSLSFLSSAKDLDAQFINSSNGSQLFMADALWINKQLPLIPPYEKGFENNFKENPYRVDFLYDKGKAIRTINQWTSERTKNKIRQLLTAKDADARTQLVLTTALTMKAKWMNPFDSRQTKFLPFYVPKRSILIDMMETIDSVYTWKGDTFGLLVLPYVPDQQMQLGMIFIVPNEGITLQQLENELTWENWEKWKKRMVREEIKMIIPRFRVEERLDLRIELNKLGLSLPFLPTADFSGMTEEKEIFIGQAIHQSIIKIDEIGTEVGGGAIVKSTPSSNEIKQFSVDRPFIYIVSDLITGAIFFMGRVVQP